MKVHCHNFFRSVLVATFTAATLLLLVIANNRGVSSASAASSSIPLSSFMVRSNHANLPTRRGPLFVTNHSFQSNNNDKNNNYNSNGNNQYYLQIPRGGATTTTSKPIEKGASIPNEIFNLIKSIVGAGVLGLPAGIAAFGSSMSALIPTFCLICIIGILSAYGFSLIGRVCSYTNTSSYGEAWAKTISPKTSWIPALACLLVTSCSVLSYSMILSDTIPKLVQAFFGKGQAFIITRTQALLSVTTVILLPLCLMKNLKSLAPFSLVGIIGMFYTCIAMAIRYFDGSYSIDKNGMFLETLDANYLPSFASQTESITSMLTNPNIFLLISMLSTAYMAHYNAPKFYLELENNTLPRFQTVVVVSFAASVLIFITVAALGFATFGANCSGLVLNNYSTQDPLMSASRVAVAMSLLFSYPLAFVGVRNGFLDLLNVKERSDNLLNMVTVALLAAITGLAYMIRDLRKLLSFGGATWGNAVIYLLPTYMFMKCVQNQMPELKKEVPQAIFTGVAGLLMGIIGTVRAIKS